MQFGAAMFFTDYSMSAADLARALELIEKGVVDSDAMITHFVPLSEVQRGFRFGISFYMIAMLFILFDIEVIFIYPIAVQLRALGTFALSETIVFVVLLMVAFVYVWRRGALEWK